MTTSAGLIHTQTTHAIIGAFFEVYNELGYGLWESVYAAALEDELHRLGHVVDRERWIDIYFKGKVIARQRVDMIVDQCVVVEIKATESLPRFASRQLLNYLTVTTLEVGLLLHFGPEAKFYRMVSSNRSRPSA
jgi:GxxExxY protein